MTNKSGVRQRSGNRQGIRSGDERAAEIYADVRIPVAQAPALHQFRAPIHDFVGRTHEIDELVQTLAAGATNGTAAVCGIRGMSGVGKTELAYVVADRLRNVFPDAQIALDLLSSTEAPLSPERTLQNAVRAFEPQVKLPDNLDDLIELYHACLNDRRVLVLADDVYDSKQMKPLLPPAGCALLVIGEQVAPLPQMHMLDLEALPEADAISLLHTMCPRIGEYAPNLAALCGYLPLALRLSAETLADDDTSDIAAYLEQLQSEYQRTSRSLSEQSSHFVNIEAALRASYGTLPEAAQHVLAQLGVFVGSFAPAAAAAVVDHTALSPAQDSHALDAILNMLYRRCLLEYDNNRCSLHPYVRDFALARLEEQGDVRAARLRHADYYAKVMGYAEDELYLQGRPQEGLALFDQERQQIDVAWQWARESGELRVGSSEAGVGNEQIDRLLMEFANASVYLGELRYEPQRERIGQFETQLAAARRQKRKDHEGWALGNLGLAYYALGDYYTAIETLEQRLAIAREMRDLRGEGTALGNVGLAYQNLGDYQKAISYHEWDVIIRHEIDDQRGEGNALGNLGLAYDNLGDHERAISYHERALAIMREIGDLNAEGSILGNLGLAYHSLGHYRQAAEQTERYLQIVRQMGNRRGEANALANLGLAYDHLGNYEQAVTSYEQALVIRAAIGDKIGEANDSWNLGLLHEHHGNLERAAELMQVCVDFERYIGHSDAEKNAKRLEQVRRKLHRKHTPRPWWKFWER
jgi:tetratricopeptide (TPR) repeat protein